MGLRIANQPLTDPNGYVTATVTKAEFGKGVRITKRAKDDIDDDTYDRFEIFFAVEGRTGPIEMKYYTGDQINGPKGEKSGGKGKPKIPIFNRITHLAIGFGLVTAKDMCGDITEAMRAKVEAGLLESVGKKVQFKLGRLEGKALTVPVPDSFKLV